MRTDHLIAAMVADKTVESRAAGRSALLLVSVALALVASCFAAYMRIRPDLVTGPVLLPVGVKIVATILLAICGVRLALALAQPGLKHGALIWALFAAPALLVAALGVELSQFGLANWQARLIGTNQLRCLVLVPSLSLLPLLALLVAMRQGAVTRPVLAGFVCGLAATGIGAAFYSLNCTDDSMLFVLTWYSLATAIVATVGALGGRLLLRW